MDQQEGEHQRCGVLASAHTRSLGPLREVTEHWQRDTAMPAHLAASVRHA